MILFLLVEQDGAASSCMTVENDSIVWFGLYY